MFLQGVKGSFHEVACQKSSFLFMLCRKSVQLPWLSTLSMYCTKYCFQSIQLLPPHSAKSSLLYWYKQIHDWMWHLPKNTRHLKDLFLILEIILNWFQNLFTQSVQLNENKFFFKDFKVKISFYCMSMTIHNFSNCVQNCVTMNDRRIYRIFSNLIRTLLQFQRAKKSDADYNRVRIRFAVESWILEKW